MREGSDSNVLSQGVELCPAHWGQSGALAANSPGATDSISGHRVWAAGTAADGRLQKTEPLNRGDSHRTLGQGTLGNPQPGWVVVLGTRVSL